MQLAKSSGHRRSRTVAKLGMAWLTVEMITFVGNGASAFMPPMFASDGRLVKLGAHHVDRSGRTNNADGLLCLRCKRTSPPDRGIDLFGRSDLDVARRRRQQRRNIPKRDWGAQNPAGIAIIILIANRPHVGSNVFGSSTAPPEDIFVISSKVRLDNNIHHETAMGLTDPVYSAKCAAQAASDSMAYPS